MRFTQELQQLLLIHSLPTTSTGTISYLESYLHASLTDLLTRLKYVIRRLNLSGVAVSTQPPYNLLLLLLHKHDKCRYYRLTQYLSWEETRRKAKESAYGVSELEMPNNEEDPDKDPEDAWCSYEASTNATSAITGVKDGLLPRDALALFEEHALISVEEDITNEAWLKQAMATPGLIEHFRTLKMDDIHAKKMSPSDYIVYTEARAQASFSHNKARTKRFADFIGPLLFALDIPVIDEVVDMLGFLAYEMTTELIKRAQEHARVRITLLREAEAGLRKQEKKAIKMKVKADSRRKKRKGRSNSEKTKKHVGAAANILPNYGKQAKMEMEEELKLKQEKDNIVPIGPFSAPPMQEAAREILTCPGTVDGPLIGGFESEATKVDNPTAMANIVSGYDLLIGDFEEALHRSIRYRRNGTIRKRRGARFIDRFR